MNKPPDPSLSSPQPPPLLLSRPSLSSPVTSAVYLSFLFNVRSKLHHELATCKIPSLTLPSFSQRGDCFIFSMKIGTICVDLIPLKSRSNLFTLLPPLAVPTSSPKRRLGLSFWSFSLEQPPQPPSGQICALNCLFDGLLSAGWLLSTATTFPFSVTSLELR